MTSIEDTFPQTKAGTRIRRRKSRNLKNFIKKLLITIFFLLVCYKIIINWRGKVCEEKLVAFISLQLTAIIFGIFMRIKRHHKTEGPKQGRRVLESLHSLCFFSFVTRLGCKIIVLRWLGSDEGISMRFLELDDPSEKSEMNKK